MSESKEDKLVHLFQRLATEAKIFHDSMQIVNSDAGWKATSIITGFYQKLEKYVKEAKALYADEPVPTTPTLGEE